MSHPIDTVVDFSLLEQHLSAHFEEYAWQSWFATVREQSVQRFNTQRYGDLQGWLDTLHALPECPASPEACDFTADAVRIGEHNEHSDDIKQKLLALKPWRKGPFNVHGVYMDTEWQSNLKWSRLAPHIDLHQRRVLDIGCGNGYYALRMLGAGASCVIGVDPSPRFLVQYAMLKKLMREHPAFHLLPLGVEDLPQVMSWFDTVFSMGVFYHRRSPIDHLLDIRYKLRAGGQMVLETLVIEGGVNDVLVPPARYAMMNNVWFLPSCDALLGWVARAGFKNVRIVDESITSTDEQRSTDWMVFHSLKDFLDPNDPTKTIEGHPAPKRAILLADAP